MNKNYEPIAVHISAQEGQPSTFWKSKSGRYYRTKAEAVNDSGKNTCNPEDYEIHKSFFAKYKYYILSAAVAAVVVAGIWYFGPTIAKKL